MFEASGFYEFIARAGEAESAAGIKLFEGVDEFALLNIHYGKRSAARYDETVPKFLKALAPYLKTAVQLSAHIAAASEPVATLEKLVAQFPTPAFLVDETGIVRK